MSRTDGTDTDIDGATGSSYELTAAEVGKTVKVTVSFTDDKGTSESVTSAETEVVTAAPADEQEAAPQGVSFPASRFASQESTKGGPRTGRRWWSRSRKPSPPSRRRRRR